MNFRCRAIESEAQQGNWERVAGHLQELEREFVAAQNELQIFLSRRS